MQVMSYGELEEGKFAVLDIEGMTQNSTGECRCVVSTFESVLGFPRGKELIE